MSASVLVGYATKYGSTQEVAEAIAATLRECGLEVDCQPVNKVRSVDKYGAVMLGAPLFIGRWHKDAGRFLSEYQQSLTQRPVAVFALGPLSADDKERQGSRSQLDTELAKMPWLKPLAVEVFAGKFDPTKLRFPDNLLTIIPASPLHGMPAKDSRDWDAIRNWASNLAATLEHSGA